jgi:hypothetical protein
MWLKNKAEMAADTKTRDCLTILFSILSPYFTDFKLFFVFY